MADPEDRPRTTKELQGDNEMEEPDAVSEIDEDEDEGEIEQEITSEQMDLNQSPLPPHHAEPRAQKRKRSEGSSLRLDMTPSEAERTRPVIKSEA